ncbi:MAG: hypothetical protein ABIY52_18115 [Gemmatimonadaceae bacterium]
MTRAYEEVWKHEIQTKLARLSSRGRQRIVHNSGHDIPDEAPDSLIAAITDVLAELRMSAPSPIAIVGKH